MKLSVLRWYIGFRGGSWEAFSSRELPTEASHGGTYYRAVGPFRSRRLAHCAAAHGHAPYTAPAHELCNRCRGEA